MKVKLSNVRLAFPELFEAKSGKDGEGEPKFRASFIIDPKNPCLAAIRDAIDAVGKEKWGAKWEAVKKGIESKDHTCLHDGDNKADYDGYEGNFFVSASNKSRPLVIDADKTPLVQSDGRPYSGCYVNGSIELWAQDNSYGKRINASLRGVQFVRDGEAFAGGGAASVDEFDSVEDDLV